MTLADIQELVVSIDPTAGHYESAHRGEDAYTEWREYELIGFCSDDEHEEGWKFQINRYSKQEGDAIALAFLRALNKDERVAFDYQTDYEVDSGYIHHIFDCEGY